MWPGETDFFHTAFTRFTLKEEVELLASCADIYCISREEQWLLANHGIESHYLPYHPPDSRVAELLTIREARSKTPPSDNEFLICVVFGNSDVRESYERQAQLLTTMFPNGGPIFHVTGYGSEELRHLYSHPLFQFHGVTEPVAWDALLRRVKAFYAHGCRGLGALTRTVDMAIAGIQVISNGITARSAFNVDGVHVYDTPEELQKALEKPYEMPPVPERPFACEQQFVRHIRTLLSA
jgi:hypothetical protein